MNRVYKTCLTICIAASMITALMLILNIPLGVAIGVPIVFTSGLIAMAAAMYKAEKT